MFSYRNAENLPREIMSILFKIKEFSFETIVPSKGSYAAQMVARAFCEQIEGCWVQIDGAFDENRFVVTDDWRNKHIIDANTFDLCETFEL